MNKATKAGFNWVGLPVIATVAQLPCRELTLQNEYRHAEVMLCADLFTTEVWTFHGLKTAYLLFAMPLETRRIVLPEATFCPHGRWMSQMGGGPR